MDLAKMERMVNRYGTVLEAVSEAQWICASDELLPATKSELSTALETYFVLLIGSGRLSADLRDHLKVGYASVATFVSAEEARLAQTYMVMVRNGRVASTDVEREAMDLGGRIVAETLAEINRRASEIDALEAQILQRAERAGQESNIASPMAAHQTLPRRLWHRLFGGASDSGS